MSLLAACPGGNILEPPVAEVLDTDLVPFATDLINGLSGRSQRSMAAQRVSRCFAVAVALARRIFALFS